MQDQIRKPFCVASPGGEPTADQQADSGTRGVGGVTVDEKEEIIGTEGVDISDMERSNRSVRPRTLVWIGLGGLLLASVALIDVQVTGPRIHIQWSPAITAGDRAALEGRYDLRNGELDEGTVWRYDLGNRSRDNIGALIHDAAVLDTGYIDRETLTPRPRDVRVTVRSFPYPFQDLVNPSELIQLRISAALLHQEIRLNRSHSRS